MLRECKPCVGMTSAGVAGIPRCCKVQHLAREVLTGELDGMHAPRLPYDVGSSRRKHEGQASADHVP